MPEHWVVVLAVLAILWLLYANPRPRRQLAAHLRAQFAPLAVRVLGPMSPEALVKATLKATRVHASETFTGAFIPNHIKVGVSCAELDSWGPLAERVPGDIEAAVRQMVAESDDISTFGRVRASVDFDPLAKARRPRFSMEVTRTRDPTSYRPVSDPEDATPIHQRRGRLTGNDITGPLCEFDVVVDGKVKDAIQLVEGRYVIGRHRACQVEVADQSVSQRHAFLAVTRDYTTVQDAGSTNGTFVGDARAEVPLVLSDGDVVKLSGEVELRVVRAGAQRRAS
jgi:hypothetical protein